MDRYARGPFNIGYEQRVDLSTLRAERIAKAQEQRRKAGLDAILVWKDENCRYLTDLRPQLIAGKTTALNGALLIEGEAPILFCSGGEHDRVQLTMPWVKEAHIIPIIEEVALVDGMVKDILGPVLKKHRLTEAKLGLDESNIVFFKALQRHFPKLQIEDGDTPMLAARRHKLPGEIVLLEEATAIADAVTASATAAIAEGVRECDVVGEAMRTLFKLGGEYSHVMTPFVASGEHMAPPNRICSDKLIRNGDIVFIDIGACFNGYFGDMARAVICGKPSDEQRKIFTAVYEGLMDGIAEMRPGRTDKDCTDAIVRAAGKYGLDGRFLSLFIAHGVGIGANEPPYIGETLPGAPTYEFEPGMVFAVEPLIWVPGVRGGGGVRLEDMVLITDGAPHVMSRAPYDEKLLLG
ncbi:Xaa-Pro aminopeptidase [Rhodovulum sp. PH10]|uniref:M24 family metallopeptidase n=1 Tax=Rhodovulum sp. PH10 TaxID=1187851 RepID=UPI00027C2DCD|nr:Xaa-Pro peptidase family protein [Rhodovulum sp. PH10]EJW10532.1 Xaa-Pro aminopeptidase [Rhodovulum sp. PH10]